MLCRLRQRQSPLVAKSRHPAARNRLLLYPQKRTFLWPSLTSGCDPKEKSAVSEEAEHWPLTTLREELIRIGARMVRHSRDVTFQMTELVVSGRMFGQILAHAAGRRAPPVSA